MDRRSLLIGAGLAALAGISYWRAPKAHVSAIDPEEFGRGLPERVADWRSRKSAEVVLPPQDGSDELYENLESRIYEAAGLPPMMVVVAYSSIQQNDVQIHRPEICYPASGFPIISSEPIELVLGGRAIQAREVAANRGGLTERIIYWVRVGDSFPTTWAGQRLTMAAANLTGSVPDGVLVRISAIEEPANPVPQVLRQFVNAFVMHSAPQFRDKILL